MRSDTERKLATVVGTESQSWMTAAQTVRMHIGSTAPKRAAVQCAMSTERVSR